MYTAYARFSNPQTQLDGSARNPLGAVYSPPSPYPSTGVFSTTALASTAGFGAPPVFKYVYFYDANALTGTMQAAPAPVYWTDESFTTVTGNAANAYITTGGASIAGYLMPNTVALGTSQTGAQWYAQLSQSYCWIQVAGFGSQFYGPTTGGAVGDYVIGLTTGSWASSGVTTISASSRVLGYQMTAVTNSLCDVLVGGLSTFWGS